MMDFSSVFSQKLKEIRIKKNLSQKTLAEKVGITAAALSSYEAKDELKRKSPTLENAASIAKELNVSLDWMCGLKNDSTTSQSNVLHQNKFTLSYYLQKIVEAEPIIGYIDITENPYRGGKIATFTISCDNIADFFFSWKKMRELREDGDISAKMYDEWITGALAQYDHLYVEDDKNE